MDWRLSNIALSNKFGNMNQLPKYMSSSPSGISQSFSVIHQIFTNQTKYCQRQPYYSSQIQPQENIYKTQLYVITGAIFKHKGQV